MNAPMLPLPEWRGEPALVANPEPVSASEDFAFFLEKPAGCYVNTGNGAGSARGEAVRR